MNPLLEAALAYAENGYAVFPLVRGEKYPATQNGVKDATTDENIIMSWWTMWPTANIGIALGKKSGVIGLDIDYKDGADPKFLEKIPPTVIVKSPNGGHHAYFKYANGPICNNLKIETGVTVRSDGYYLVAPPSILSSGKKYETIGKDIYCGEILECPDWFTEIGIKEQENKKPFSMPEQILDGEGREKNLVSLAGALRAKGLSENEILAGLEAANSRCIPPKPMEDLKRIAKSYSKKEIAKEEYKKEKLDFPDLTADYKKKGTIENLKVLLNHLGITVRYNVISKEEEILIPNESFTVDNKANATLAYIISWCKRYSLPTPNLGDYLTKIADQNLYNPVVEWIKSIPWDKQSRLNDFYETVSSPTKLKNVLIRKWLISAIAAIYNPLGVSAHGVLVFRGEQYIGKTRWFKRLAPEHLEVLKDGAILRPDDKDSVFQIITKWLVELGELDATFRKADIAQLKSFITKDSDVIRRAYSKKESHYARRTVFFASVNEQCFLNDPTGNRRFWTIECEKIDHEHTVDMQQLWAEVYEIYKSGESWYLTANENNALNENNESFQTMDPIEERIRHDFDWDSKLEPAWLSATQVCEKIGINHPNNQQARKAGSALRKVMKHRTKIVDGITRFAVAPYKLVVV